MPTQYNIQIMAEHPLTMGFNIPHPLKDVIPLFEVALQGVGLSPVGITVARNDDPGELLYESAQWSLPAPLLVAAAKLLEAELAQKMDPESDLWDPKFCTGEPWVEMVDLAKDIIERRGGR